MVAGALAESWVTASGVLKDYRSYSLNSLKGGYIGEYIGDYHRAY